jgi:hypothetical protein
MSDIKVVAGWVAGILSLFAYIPYSRAILKRETRPNRATWFIWTLVSFLTLASYWSSGARETIWVPVIYVVMSLTTALLSLKYGEGGWTRFDKWCIFVAATSAMLWRLSGSPLVALILSLAIDFAGALPTIRKVWKDPASEDRFAWSLFFSGNISNLFAVKEWTFAVALYTIYMFLGTGAIATLVLFKPRKVKPR